jgi:hypothetical protein
MSLVTVVGFSEVEEVQSTLRRPNWCGGQTYMIVEAGSALNQEQQRAGRTGRLTSSV